MTATAMQITEKEIAELPLNTRFPEGAWRVPVELGVALANSALAPVVKQRFDLGDRPYRDCVVFLRDGRFFVWVEFENDQPGRRHPAILMPVAAWSWESTVAPTIFGKRKVKP